MPIDVGLPGVPIFKGRATASQPNIASGSWTPVVLNNQRFYALRALSVFVSAKVMFDTIGTAPAASTARRVAAVFKGPASNSGVQVDGSDVWGAYPNDYYTLTTPTVPVDLAAGEFLELGVYSLLANTTLYGNTGVSGSVMTVWAAA